MRLVWLRSGGAEDLHRAAVAHAILHRDDDHREANHCKSDSKNQENTADRKNDGRPCLEDVFKFHESVCSLERKNPRKKLVFQAGENQSVQTITGFLLGCHLLITHGIEYDRLCLTFRDFHDMFDDIGCDFADSISIHSCWRALWRAKCLKWIEFEKMTHTDPEKDYCIHIDEYIHYARCDFAFIGSLAMSTGI